MCKLELVNILDLLISTLPLGGITDTNTDPEAFGCSEQVITDCYRSYENKSPGCGAHLMQGNRLRRWSAVWPNAHGRHTLESVGKWSDCDQCTYVFKDICGGHSSKEVDKPPCYSTKKGIMGWSGPSLVAPLACQVTTSVGGWGGGVVWTLYHLPSKVATRRPPNSPAPQQLVVIPCNNTLYINATHHSAVVSELESPHCPIMVSLAFMVPTNKVYTALSVLMDNGHPYHSGWLIHSTELKSVSPQLKKTPKVREKKKGGGDGKLMLAGSGDSSIHQAGCHGDFGLFSQGMPWLITSYNACPEASVVIRLTWTTSPAEGGPN